MIPLLALLIAFPPLSTDMYLPALPMLQNLWQQPLVIINLTLVLFFVVYCMFLLVYGPVSDRFGRRAPLLVGIGLYIMASLACAGANGIWMLLLARIFQAAGAASAAAHAMAMVKDIYEGATRERILAQMSIIMALAPMLAPILGGWIVAFASWRWIFLAQAGMGAIAIAGVLRMPETLRHRSASGFIPVASAYFRLFRNSRFIVLTLVMSSISLPTFAFIAGSSDIYMGHFGMDEREFGYFFAFNAIGLMAGAFAFTRLSRRILSRRLMTAGFTGILCAALLLIVAPHGSPWGLALPMWILSFCGGLTRPPSSSLILNQVSRDTGSASSLIGFTFLMIGAAGMYLISLNWPDKITAIGAMGLGSGSLVLLFWIAAQRRWFRPCDAPQTSGEGLVLAQSEEI